MNRMNLKFDLQKKLMETLDEIVKHYRSLLTVVRKEKEILVAAELDKLSENNKVKEELILKIKALDGKRLKIAQELADCLSIEGEDNLRLHILAGHFEGKESEKMMNVKSVLELIIKRVVELNKFNEELVKSALNNITGAMDNIKNTLSEETTYKKKSIGKYKTARAGSLVSKEA